MITIFRAVSQREKEDYDINQLFRTSRNTLEAKQFFKTRTAINSFVERAIEQGYNPPYVFLLEITLDDDLFDVEGFTKELDGFQAIHIDEDDLEHFNNCVNFVQQEDL